MKVNIGKEFYVVHWRKRQFHPRYGNRFDLNLDETTCIIKTLEVGGNTEVASTHTVRQNIDDSSNDIRARKLSFTGALGSFFHKKDDRRIFWEEYKRTMRFTPRSFRAKYLELKNKLDKIQKENERLKGKIESALKVY